MRSKIPDKLSLILLEADAILFVEVKKSHVTREGKMIVRTRSDVVREGVAIREKLVVLQAKQGKLYDRINALQQRYEEGFDLEHSLRERLSAIHGFIAIMNERERDTIELS